MCVGGNVAHMDKSPWAELTDLQKREQIALRLGWQDIHLLSSSQLLYGHDTPPPWIHFSKLVPRWPTNDGLAFEEVLPLLIAECVKRKRWVLFTWVDMNDGLLEITADNSEGDSTQYRLKGVKAADAICRAAYELLPV